MVLHLIERYSAKDCDCKTKKLKSLPVLSYFTFCNVLYIWACMSGPSPLQEIIRCVLHALRKGTIKPSFDSYPDHPLPSGSSTPITRQSAAVKRTILNSDEIELGPTSVLLYNPKWNMWSTLPSISNAIKPPLGCPLVVYGDKLLFLSCQGRLYEFICETGGWEVNKSIDPNIINFFVLVAIYCSTCMGRESPPFFLEVNGWMQLHGIVAIPVIVHVQTYTCH